jgi:hypothetical protein
MNGICASAQAAGALGRPPRGSLYYQHLFCRTHFIPPWTRGDPPSTSPTLMVAAAGPAASAPRRPAIDVSNSGGGHSRTFCQPPLGGSPSTSLTPVVAAAGPTTGTPQGARHRRVAKHGTYRQNFSGDTYQRGKRGKHYHYKQAIWWKNRGKSLAKKIRSLQCKNSGVIIPLQK